MQYPYRRTMRAQALFMSDSIRDVRYGLRAMLRSPGFTIIALLTLMLGIGATTAIFSVVDAVLLRALSYRDPQRVVSVFEDAGEISFPRNTPTPGNYADFKAQAQVFEKAAAEAYRQYNLTGTAGEPEKLNGAAVTHNLFQVLGVKPLLGGYFCLKRTVRAPHTSR